MPSDSTDAAVPLRVAQLVKEYTSKKKDGSDGKIVAVAGVTFDIKPGEILGLLGPNGAGKTSVIATTVTLEKPTSGRVEIFGYDVVKEPERAKMITGYVPQELIHHGFFNVEEILRFHSGYYGRRNNRERIDWLMQKLSLWEHREKKVKQLSGGMKRRLLIAKALVHEPKLLLLDEPTAGVDIDLRESLWQFVGELKSAGMSILLTTHYIQEAEQLCDRVGILQKGQLLHLGPTRDLVKDLTRREIAVRMKNGKDLVFQVPVNKGAGDFLLEAGLELREIDDLVIREGSLEDALKRVLRQQV